MILFNAFIYLTGLNLSHVTESITDVTYTNNQALPANTPSVWPWSRQLELLIFI